METNWRVVVYRDGEQIVSMEPNELAGRDLSEEDEAAIRTAGEHLLAFVGDGSKPIFNPDEG